MIILICLFYVSMKYKHIILLGDSILDNIGWVGRDGRSITMLLEEYAKMQNKQSSDATIQIHNLASDGMACNGGRMDFINGAEFAFC